MFLITGATKEENVYMNLKNENIQQRNTAHTLMLISYSLPGDWTLRLCPMQKEGGRWGEC